MDYKFIDHLLLRAAQEKMSPILPPQHVMLLPNPPANSDLLELSSCIG